MRYVVFDVETPNAKNDRMSSLGIAVVENGEIVEEFYSLINPETYFNSFNVALTGISERSVKGAPTFPEIFEKVKPIFESGLLVAHNAPFDMGVLSKCLRDYGISWKTSVPYLCTCKIARSLKLGTLNNKLNTLCDYFSIELEHHNALSDARAAAKLFAEYEKLGVRVENFIARAILA